MRVGPQDFALAQGYREPPRNIEAEQGLLGALLLNNKVYEVIAPVVAVADFFEVAHQRLFEVCSTLIGANQAATPVTLKAFFADRPFDEVSFNWPAYLANLVAQHAAPPLLAKDYAQQVHDLAVRRRIIDAAQEVQDQAYDLPASIRPAQMAGEAIAALHAIAGREGAQNTRREAHEAIASAIDNIGKGRARRITTGFRDLDDVTEGYQPGTLWVVGARPGAGKTALAATSANKVAKAGSGVMLFSLEVPEEQMRSRLLSDLAYDRRQPISFKNIMSGEVDDTAMWLVEDAYERSRTMPLVLDVSSRLTSAEIRVRVKAEKDRMAAKGVVLRVIFIDYLKQIQASDRYKGSRVYEIGEITYSLKQLAKDEGICVVLLAQLNRQNEAREDKRPGLSDLRDSGDLETDADVVAFIHREAYYIQRSAEYRGGEPEAQDRFDRCEHEAELILGKNRIGPATTINLFCDIACSTMSDAAHGDRP